MIIGRLRSLNFEWPTPLAGSSSTFYAAKCPSLDGEISPVGRAPELSAGYSPARSASFRCREETFACRDKRRHCSWAFSRPPVDLSPGVPHPLIRGIWSRSDCASMLVGTHAPRIEECSPQYSPSEVFDADPRVVFFSIGIVHSRDAHGELFRSQIH